MEVINPTNLPPAQVFPVGTICNLIDPVDVSFSVNCTIKYIEPDDEYQGLVYYYLVANDETLNQQTDPRFPWRFYTLSTNADEHLVPLSAPAP